MSKTLAQIENESNLILAAYDDTAEGLEGDDEALAKFVEDVEAILAQLGEEKADKIDGYGQFITKLEAEEARLATVIKNLTARKKAAARKIDGIKSHLLSVMEFFGEKKIEGTTFVAAIREGKSVSVTDEAKLPDEFWRIIPETKTPDKKEIMAALKVGDVAGAEIVTSRNVHIK